MESLDEPLVSFATKVEEHQTWRVRVIARIGDVHDLLQPFRDLVERVPPNVHTIIQVGDLWVWPEEEDVPPAADGSRRELPKRPRDPSMHWRPPVREVHALARISHIAIA